jgi:SsrA-binding protein
MYASFGWTLCAVAWTWSPLSDGSHECRRRRWEPAAQSASVGSYSPMAKGKGKRKIGAGDVASNRYASYRYELIERLECGIMLEGTEVKALRTSGAQLKDGYAAIQEGEMWLHSVHIPPYGPASRENHEPERTRKLLLHRRELDRIAGRTAERGLTLVPTRIYFSGSHAKVEIALARGKDLYDKRHTIRERETKRDMERGIREARR